MRRRRGAALRRRCASDQRGSVIVEAAIVFPALLLIIFGALEYGLLFRDDLTGSNAVRAVGRSVSAQATLPTADQAGIKALLPAAAAFDGGASKVSRVVIYIASCASPQPYTGQTAWRCGSDPPIKNVKEMVGTGAPCADKTRTAGVSDYCNVYAGVQLTDGFANGPGNWTCTTTPPPPDRFWCPTRRLSLQGIGTDYVGIHIEYTHEWATKLFGTTRDMTDDVVFRVEPQGS